MNTYVTPHTNAGRRMVSVGQKKVINDIEQMYMHDTLMVKHTPTVVVAQSQGYKPKSRRWLNHFN